MSFTGLYIGASGLSAAQRALETAGHNVANAQTKGYSRQRVESSTAPPVNTHRGPLGPGATGQGVLVDAVTRAHDALVSANVRDTAAQAASWGTRADFFGRAEQILGPLDTGASAALSDFWNSWEALSQSPDSATSRAQVLDAGRRLTDALHDAHNAVTTLRTDVGFSLTAKVVEASDLAAEIASLNGQIKAVRGGGNVPNDLLDRRDQALNRLAGLTGAQTVIESDGDARVTINNLPIVDGLGADALTVTGSPPDLIWARTGDVVAAGGELGALAELATTGAQDILDRLDTIAIELRDVVNTAHQAGFGLDGVGGRPFFAGTGADNIRLDPTLTNATVAASASGEPADGNHAIAMGGLRSAVGSGGQTVGELVNALQGFLGLEAAHSTSQRDLAEIVVNDAWAGLAEVAGVSIDEELTEMLRFQRAYDASARVITVIDQLLDRLINGTGATR